jgi:hypothetical protein
MLNPIRVSGSAAMPKDRLVQLVLGGRPGRQAIVPVVMRPCGVPPEKVTVRRSERGVAPYTAPAAPELDHGEIGAGRSSGSQTDRRQQSNYHCKSHHSSTPQCWRPSAAGSFVAGGSRRLALPNPRFAPAVVHHRIVPLRLRFVPALQADPVVFPPRRQRSSLTSLPSPARAVLEHRHGAVGARRGG